MFTCIKSWKTLTFLDSIWSRTKMVTSKHNIVAFFFFFNKWTIVPCSSFSPLQMICTSACQCFITWQFKNTCVVHVCSNYDDHWTASLTRSCSCQVLLWAAGPAARWLHGQLGLQVLGREAGWEPQPVVCGGRGVVGGKTHRSEPLWRLWCHQLPGRVAFIQSQGGSASPFLLEKHIHVYFTAINILWKTSHLFSGLLLKQMFKKCRFSLNVASARKCIS